MSALFIDSVSAPDEIKDQLKTLSKDIKFAREITKGGNGYLFFGENRILRTKIAVKFYYWGGDKKYHAEPSVLAAIESQHVLSVHNAGLLNGEWAYFVTPYCANGDLDDLIDKTELGNFQAIDLTCQLLTGIGALHQKRFLHRDLKPANIYLSDQKQSIIGDFGSIKHLPESSAVIPASGHAILYRPPESIETNSYGFTGDIYQAGIVLYQLLGGNLPYDEFYWLSKKERQIYNELSTDADKSIYSDQCLKAKILKGKVIDLNSLPPWVSEKLKRIIRKATHVDPSKRFPTASAFHVQLNNIRSETLDWVIEDGFPILRGKTSFRIVDENESFYVQKNKNGSQWRKDNSIAGSSLAGLVEEIIKLA
ncbi:MULTISPECIES: serine/threonine-protein kinase [Shewanella]|uniref:serine/threonine-protein kinase n=1 Tax=Shewanella TaxID=22 RepID=UPI000D361C6E|nr:MULTISPECIES: serine/threonine-protein kinase [Shewanella]MCI2962580.1 serine/threonine protein kinase [Shewanella sp. N2AIL]